MNDRKRSKARARRALGAVSGAALCLAAVPVLAQDASTPLTGTVSADPNPYYVGVGQGFTHDSNVYRVPNGRADTYSSTSVFGGFNQLISRQRVFGRANVSLHRYQDEKQLDNTSYDLAAGADLSTIENLSGNLNVGFSSNLVSPPASVGVPTAIRNEEQIQRVGGSARWGGPALLTIEGSARYMRLDYSAPEYVTSETREATGSLGVFYRPGALLRIGVAARFEKTRTPQAVLDPATGNYFPNTTEGRNFDLLAEYLYGGSLSGSTRLSYTRTTNSQVRDADFSGFTGNLAISWRATGKTTFQFDISRDAGFETASTTRYSVVESGTGVVLTPVSALYENNRLTDSVGLGVTYAATAKIAANARLRYSRGDVVSPTTLAGASTEWTDKFRGASLGISYAITRTWGASCSFGYETRDVSGPTGYSYDANVVGCSTQFTWR
jgi:hypothetical protein